MATEESPGKHTQEAAADGDAVALEGEGYLSLVDLKGDAGFTDEIRIPATQFSWPALMVASNTHQPARVFAGAAPPAHRAEETR